jgi:hypothetical protein
MEFYMLAAIPKLYMKGLAKNVKNISKTVVS